MAIGHCYWILDMAVAVALLLNDRFAHCDIGSKGVMVRAELS